MSSFRFMKKIIYILAVVCLFTLCGCVTVEFTDSGMNNFSSDAATDGKTTVEMATDVSEETEIQYVFRNDSLWKDHFIKHGEEFPYETKEDYLAGANKALSNPDILHKLEGEDGDHVYYLEETNEIIFVSKDGYIRTYFKPTKGKKYFDKQ